MVKAYTYIRSLGGDGLREVSEHAVLNANYRRLDEVTAARRPNLRWKGGFDKRGLSS